MKPTPLTPPIATTDLPAARAGTGLLAPHCVARPTDRSFDRDSRPDTSVTAQYASLPGPPDDTAQRKNPDTRTRPAVAAPPFVPQSP